MKRNIRTLLERAGGADGRTDRAAPRSAAGGFTLIELLIGIGALALVAAGVAAIFEATAKTVQTGRRVSAMASYAALIERQMRDDFANMTRDGYLIIKNEYADGVGDGNIVIPNPSTGLPDDYCVPLSENDRHKRLRRTDEIMFFCKGQFVSARELLGGQFIAKSDAAAVYYGHGQKGRAPVPNTPPSGNGYYNPSVNATNVDQYARLGYQGPMSPAATVNPNRYAADWILLRHVTLLRPVQSEYTRAGTQVFGMTAVSGAVDPLDDSDVQIALQPAASNLFRSLSSIFPVALLAASVRLNFDNTKPFRSSGLVDIATTDLPEIKQIITTADRGPGAGPGPWAAADGNFFNPANNAAQDGNNAGVDGQARPEGPGPNKDPAIVWRQQVWMDDGLPAWSMASGGQVASRSRIRCEAAPVNFTGVLSQGLPANDPELPSRRADQLMLAASDFLPHCTEFIVEWSFGVQYPSDPTAANYNAQKAGQLVWYGMPRVVNGDVVANTYELPLAPPPPGSANQFPWNVTVATPFELINGTPMSFTVGADLIHGKNFNQTQPASDPVTSYFGYNNPQFNPDLAAPIGQSAPDGKLISPGDSATPTIPWAWPRFVRITMSLADPNNPLVEQSFQFVFDVPVAQ